MAKTTIKKDIIPYKALSIQVSLNGLSFCVLNADTNTIELLRHYHAEKQLNPLDMLNLLKTTIDKEPALQENFKSILIIHENDISSLVPKPLFNEENLADYLKFNAKILKTDYIDYDELKINDSVNVYVPYVNINNYIYGNYGDFIFKHYSSVLIEEVLKIEKNAKKAKMYVNVASNHFDIVVIENSSLKLYNTFEYETKEDFIYYILFASEQLGLNPEEFELIFTGDVDSKSELYAIAFKYVRFVFFAKRMDNFKFSDDAQPNNENDDFVILHSFL